MSESFLFSMAQHLNPRSLTSTLATTAGVAFLDNSRAIHSAKPLAKPLSAR